MRVKCLYVLLTVMMTLTVQCYSIESCSSQQVSATRNYSKFATPELWIINGKVRFASNEFDVERNFFPEPVEINMEEYFIICKDRHPSYIIELPINEEQCGYYLDFYATRRKPGFAMFALQDMRIAYACINNEKNVLDQELDKLESFVKLLNKYCDNPEKKKIKNKIIGEMFRGVLCWRTADIEIAAEHDKDVLSLYEESIDKMYKKYEELTKLGEYHYERE